MLLPALVLSCQMNRASALLLPLLVLPTHAYLPPALPRRSSLLRVRGGEGGRPRQQALTTMSSDAPSFALAVLGDLHLNRNTMERHEVRVW